MNTSFHEVTLLPLPVEFHLSICLLSDLDTVFCLHFRNNGIIFWQRGFRQTQTSCFDLLMPDLWPQHTAAWSLFLCDSPSVFCKASFLHVNVTTGSHSDSLKGHVGSPLPSFSHHTHRKRQQHYINPIWMRLTLEGGGINYLPRFFVTQIIVPDTICTTVTSQGLVPFVFSPEDVEEIVYMLDNRMENRSWTNTNHLFRSFFRTFADDASLFLRGRVSHQIVGEGKTN